MLNETVQRVGIMGGMFDPVHAGHLQLATRVHEQCRLDEVRLVPCGNPVHRPHSAVAASHRIKMLELAVLNIPWLRVDTRECVSQKPSYTYNTLAALQAELPAARLFLLLGLDTFLALDTWYRWQELTEFATLIVASRPGYSLQTARLSSAFGSFVADRLVGEDVQPWQVGPGQILLLNLQTPALSSTEVREKIAHNADLSGCLQPLVSEYINTHKLYLQTRK